MMLKKFIDYLEFEKRYSPHTINSYKTDLTQFKLFLKVFYDELNWNEVGHSHIRSWMVDLVSKNQTAKSINRKISSLRSFYNFLRKQGVVTKNPTIKIVTPKIPKRLPSFINENQIEKLFDTIDLNDFEDIRNRLMIELLYSTGTRRQELLNLRDSDIDSSNRMIKVLGKGNKERYIPISNEMIHKIKKWQEIRDSADSLESNSGYLFVSKKGRKLYPKALYNVVKRYLSSVTTSEKKSPHVLRHSFATHLMNNGADLNAVKELLGHSSLAATQVYTHNSIEKLKDIYKKSHPRSYSEKK